MSDPTRIWVVDGRFCKNIPIYEIPVEKVTPKLYRVPRCKGSWHGVQIPRDSGNTFTDITQAVPYALDMYQKRVEYARKELAKAERAYIEFLDKDGKSLSPSIHPKPQEQTP